VLALAGAAVSLARDEPDAAAALLDQADLASMTPRPAGEPSIAVISGLLRARLALAEGNLAGARGLVRWLTDASAGAVQAGYWPGLDGQGAASLTGASTVNDVPGSGGEPAQGVSAGAPAPGQLASGAGPGPSGLGRARPYGAAAVIAALDAEISFAGGERERARATLDGLAGPAAGLDPDEDHAPAEMPARPEAIVGQARLLIADSDDKGALALVAPMLADVTGACSVADRISALLVAVVAHRRLGQATEAAELLSQALAVAEPEDACGPFIAAGSPVRSALTVLISPSSRCAGFAGRVLDRFDGRAPRPSSAQSAALLTDSELAVLRFLPSHMTNQEIAEALFLSINTIKTHLSSVYRKLGVANRRQAIAQGRRLELL
jgi:DNA-binding CsgD family transcriptional regulator